MRIVFAGTPEFAEVALRALHRAGHEIVLVLTQPDRQSGRGLKTLFSPVKKAALELGLALSQPQSLKKPLPETLQAKAEIANAKPDLMVVAAYGLILPADVLQIPGLGCLNIHASILPRWRGAAPIQRAIQAGDTHTGVCIMQMEEGLDTGPVWAKKETQIGQTESFGALHDRLAQMGADLLVGLLAKFPAKGCQLKAQPEAGVTYAEKISRAEAHINWDAPAIEIANQIRAFDPVPGAYAVLMGEPVKLFEPELISEPLKNTPPGQIIKADAKGLWVACKDRPLALASLQRPGGKRLGVREFLNGHKVKEGLLFN